jgi:hypothetical protein
MRLEIPAVRGLDDAWKQDTQHLLVRATRLEALTTRCLHDRDSLEALLVVVERPPAARMASRTMRPHFFSSAVTS